MNYDEYLENDRELFESTLTPPDKLWLVMDDDNEIHTPYNDKYEAEQLYWSMKDVGENVRIGYIWDGSITGSMPYKEVERNFKEVRI